MLKSSFSLEVEMLWSSTKVYMEMRKFGPFPSSSSLSSLRTVGAWRGNIPTPRAPRREVCTLWIRQVYLALIMEKEELLHSFPSSFCCMSWYLLHTHGLKVTTEFTFSAEGYLLFVFRVSLLACVCVCVCVVVFASGLLTAVQGTGSSCSPGNPHSLCPCSIGEVFFYPLLQLIIMPCLCSCNYFYSIYKTYVAFLLKYSHKNSRNKPILRAYVVRQIPLK